MSDMLDIRQNSIRCAHFEWQKEAGGRGEAPWDPPPNWSRQRKAQTSLEGPLIGPPIPKDRRTATRSAS